MNKHLPHPSQCRAGTGKQPSEAVARGADFTQVMS